MATERWRFAVFSCAVSSVVAMGCVGTEDGEDLGDKTGDVEIDLETDVVYQLHITDGDEANCRSVDGLSGRAPAVDRCRGTLESLRMYFAERGGELAVADDLTGVVRFTDGTGIEFRLRSEEPFPVAIRSACPTRTPVRFEWNGSVYRTSSVFHASLDESGELSVSRTRFPGHAHLGDDVFVEGRNGTHWSYRPSPYRDLVPLGIDELMIDTHLPSDVCAVGVFVNDAHLSDTEDRFWNSRTEVEVWVDGERDQTLSAPWDNYERTYVTQASLTRPVWVNENSDLEFRVNEVNAVTGRARRRATCRFALTEEHVSQLFYGPNDDDYRLYAELYAAAGKDISVGVPCVGTDDRDGGRVDLFLHSFRP